MIKKKIIMIIIKKTKNFISSGIVTIANTITNDYDKDNFICLID